MARSTDSLLADLFECTVISRVCTARSCGRGPALIAPAWWLCLIGCVIFLLIRLCLQQDALLLGSRRAAVSYQLHSISAVAIRKAPLHDRRLTVFSQAPEVPGCDL